MQTNDRRPNHLTSIAEHSLLSKALPRLINGVGLSGRQAESDLWESLHSYYHIIRMILFDNSLTAGHAYW
jgi:hypothetical protein